MQVKAAVLDPDNEFNVERTLTKEDVQKLIQVELMLSVAECNKLSTVDMCLSPARPQVTSTGYCQDASPL